MADMYVDTNCLVFAADYIQRQKESSLGALPANYRTKCENVVEFLDWCSVKKHALHTLQFSYVQMLYTFQIDEYYKKQMMIKVKPRDILYLKQANNVLQSTDIDRVKAQIEALMSSWPYTFTWHPVARDFPKWTVGFWPLAKAILEMTHMDAEDALHFAAACVTDCSHILTDDGAFRSSAERLRQMTAFRAIVAPLVGKRTAAEVKIKILSVPAALGMATRSSA